MTPQLSQAVQPEPPTDKQALQVIFGFLTIFVMVIGGSALFRKHPPKPVDYIVTSYQSSTYTFKDGQIPAQYEVRHGCVLIHAQCSVIAGPQAPSFPCTGLPDPQIPVGEPVNIKRVEQSSLLFTPANTTFGDSVWLEVQSEAVIPKCQEKSE